MEFIVDGWMEPIADGRLVLLGQRCEDCSATYFPASTLCKRCSSERLVTHRLGPEAELHSYALDHMGTFLGRPHFVGQVRFAEGAFVQGYIDGPLDDEPVIASTVDLVPFELSVRGEPALTYGFRARGEW